ncbi:MAG: copper amine oxidase N-terminal domain-containing protein [Defluviitaleaceae bacterium]|nr:copper amine oxidase N-terminal domain-containing protein [Defluviitaleaceae bacterium]
MATKINKRKATKKIAALALAGLILSQFAAVKNAAYANDYVVNTLIEVEMDDELGYAVVDVLDGVEARYRTMDFPDIYGEYSCAGFIKTYYAAVYGIEVTNLTDTGPLMPEDQLIRVDTPQKGDIIFYPEPPNRNNHSAIVKAFDGQKIMVIEQNYKFRFSGSTYTYLNRTIDFPPDENNFYEIWRPAFVSDEPYEVAGDHFEEFETDMEIPEFFPGGEDEVGPRGLIPVPEVAAEPVYSYEAIVMIGRMAITVNGVDMPINAPAMIENNRTIMPLRFVSYALGLNSENLIWDALNQTVTVVNGDDTIMFVIGSDVMYINGVPFGETMDVPAQIKPGGVTYIPLAYLATALGVDYIWVEYDDLNKAAIFYKF